jgi:hypothetical protein
MPWQTWRTAADARVARTATSLADPVSRLRYLKAARQPAVTVRRSHALRWILGPTALLLALPISFLVRHTARWPETPPVALAFPRGAPSGEARENTAVWQVEHTGTSEAYSNGLRIDTRYTVNNRPRLYTAFERDGPSSIKRVRLSQPAGIVYHTTESCQAPFEARDTPVLQRLGESLLDYVRRKCAYHYLIDRFGRVYRVVAESDAADHAGYSVWADAEWFYLNLNEAFLGVSFEARTEPSQEGGIANPAQVRAAAMLTEMLRSRYRIPAGNCIPHAQVSVNPSNMLIGYHTDWSVGFPFAELGLPDNYQLPLPALWAFGFDCEPAWLISSGMAPGIRLAQRDIAQYAAAAGVRPPMYRKALRERYRVWLAEMRRTGPPSAQLSSGSAGR